MKQNKQLLKIFGPILIFFIALFIAQFQKGVDTYVQKEVQRIDNTSEIYDISFACNKYMFEGKSITELSPEFLELYENWESNYVGNGNNYKAVFNKDAEIYNFDLCYYSLFDADILMTNMEASGGIGGSYTIDLSILDASQKEKVVSILKENYQQELLIEVQGKRGLDGASVNEFDGEVSYMYEKVTASYLKLNDTVIIGTKPEMVVTGGFEIYNDENMYLASGYDYYNQAQYEGVTSVYIDKKRVRDVFADRIQNQSDINEIEYVMNNSEEINGDYYIFSTTTIPQDNLYTPLYLASITVLPNLRSTMESQFINDNMLLYIGFAFIFITSILITKYKVLQPTKQVLEKIKEIENEYNVESTTTTLKTSVLQLEKIEEVVKDKTKSLEDQVTALRQQLEEYSSKEVIEKQDVNEIEKLVNTVLLKYTMLLNNKKIEVVKDINTNQTRYNREDLEYLFIQICNRVVYLVAMQGNINICINPKEISVRYTSNAKTRQNNITIEINVKEILEKYQSTYRIEENDKEVSIIFSC